MVAEGGEGEKVVGDQSKHPWVERRELPVSVREVLSHRGTQPAHSEHCSNWLSRQHSFPDDSRGGQLENSRAWLCRQDRCFRNRMVSNSLSKSRRWLALMFMFEQVSRQTAVQMRYYPSCPRSSPRLLKRVLHMRNDQRYENKKPFHIFIKSPVHFQALLLWLLLLIFCNLGLGFETTSCSQSWPQVLVYNWQWPWIPDPVSTSWVFWLEVCTTIASLYGTGRGTQDFIHFRQAFC